MPSEGRVSSCPITENGQPCLWTEGHLQPCAFRKPPKVVAAELDALTGRVRWPKPPRCQADTSGKHRWKYAKDRTSRECQKCGTTVTWLNAPARVQS